jgi:hypothetical protein
MTFPPCYFCDRPTGGDVYYLDVLDGTIKVFPVCFDCRDRHLRFGLGRRTAVDFINDREGYHPAPSAPPMVTVFADRRLRPRAM